MHTETSDVIALKAFGFIMEDDTLRERFLALTGLDVESLRDSLSEPTTLASVLEFLISHEPDLIDAAKAQQLAPETLVTAWRDLGGGAGQEW